MQSYIIVLLAILLSSVKGQATGQDFTFSAQSRCFPASECDISSCTYDFRPGNSENTKDFGNVRCGHHTVFYSDLSVSVDQLPFGFKFTCDHPNNLHFGLMSRKNRNWNVRTWDIEIANVECQASNVKLWSNGMKDFTSTTDDELVIWIRKDRQIEYYNNGVFMTYGDIIAESQFPVDFAISPPDNNHHGYLRNIGYVSEKPQEKTVVAVELSSNALQVVTDIGEQAFNSKFKACPVVQYNRNGAIHSVYKRITPIPDNFNAYKIFTETWRNTPTNTMGTDFEIFSNVNDLLNDQNQWTYCNYNDPDVAYPRDCGRHGWVPNQWFSMPGGHFNARGITNGAGFTLFNDCPIDFAFLEDCRWETSHDQTPNSADYMGWTCADNEILTGFGLSANEHDITKVQCCKLGGHSAVKPNTCTYVDSNHERAKCGNGNDHMVFSGAYDKRAATVDAVTEILAGKCCEVECDSAWCAGKDWGVDKNNCQVISTSNTNAQELICPTGTLMTEVEDGLASNAHGVQKVASVTCCALDLIAPPTMAPSRAPSAAPTTARPTSAPTQAPSTSMPTLAPTSVDDCLLGLRDPQLTNSEYLAGIDRCLPGCRSDVPHRRALESRLLSENNRRQ